MVCGWSCLCPNGYRGQACLTRYLFSKVYKKMFSHIEDILDDIRVGRSVIVVDDEGRENEGDLVIAAQFANSAAINFMITIL